MKKTKTQKGITLVALIITIVVLLVLAVVAIQEIVGDGIITYATTAMENQKIAQIKEEAELVKTEAQAEYFLSGKTLDQAELLRLINEHFEGSTIEGNAVILKDGKYKITIDANKNMVVGKNEETNNSGEGEGLEPGEIAIECEVAEYSSNNKIKVNILIGGETYEQFTTRFLANKTDVEVEEYLLKTMKYLGTFEELLVYQYGEGATRESVAAVFEQQGMNYRQALEYNLIQEAGTDSWMWIEYYVSLAGGEGLDQTGLEILLIDLYNYPGTFEELLTVLDENLTRENLLAYAQSEGYRTEEDIIKYYISELYKQNNSTDLNFTVECINGEKVITKTTDMDNLYAEFMIHEPGTYTVKVTASNEKTAQEQVGVSELKTKHSEVIIPTIEATGNFANNPNIAEVREGNVPIPTGYTYVKGDVNGGVVIKDSSGNEWVWVPATVSEISEVVNGKNVGKLYDFSTTGATAKTYPTTSNSGYREPDVITGYDGDTEYLSIVLEGEYANTQTAASFKAQLQAEFDNMIESVSKYGGYYIGRYEAGGTINSPVLKQGATVIRNTSDSSNWYYMYTSAKKLAANESVTTGMIWGCQWDNTLRWLVNSNNLSWSDLTDSREWGNYYDSQGSASENSREGRSAGYSEYWKAGNIYDLAGNYYDWTLEACSNFTRVGRGGNYKSIGGSSPASCRVRLFDWPH